MTLLGRFHLANRLVTQHEYLAFIRDGGYSRPELWLSQGWDRVCAEAGARRSWEGARRLASLHIARHAGTGAAGACHARELLRGRRLRPLGGSGCRASPNGNPPRAASLTAAPACTPTCWKAATWIRDPRPPGQAGRAPPALRRRLGVDQQRLRGLSRLPPGQRRGGRIQRQIHVQSIRAARRLLRHAARPHPASYRNFFPPEALAVFRNTAGAGRLRPALVRNAQPHRPGCGPGDGIRSACVPISFPGIARTNFSC